MTEPQANAFRLYRNYDGSGGAFGETGVRAVSDDQGKVSVYAALRKGGNTLTVMVVNKTVDTLATELKSTGSRRAGRRRCIDTMRSSRRSFGRPIRRFSPVDLTRRFRGGRRQFCDFTPVIADP